jgi:hypothetical protein
MFAAGCASSPPPEGMFSALRDPANARFAMGGITPAEAGLRYGVARADSAAVALAMSRLPGDTLLRLLHWGLAHHRAGRWAQSNTALQAADQLAEERYTRSVRQALGAALLNDLVVDYVPPAHERAFIHYYGMLNYVALGDRESALVEARKANLFLERYAREHGSRTYTVDATVEYVAGALHLDAGDRNDALVSFRKADSAYAVYGRAFGMTAPAFVAGDVARLGDAMGVQLARGTPRPQQQGRANTGEGHLLVLVENGYIAHKVQEKLYVAITETERHALRRHRDHDGFRIGSDVAERTLRIFTDPGTSEYTRRHADGVAIGTLASGGELLTLAWSRYRLAASGADSILVSVGGRTESPVLMNDLSAIAARSFEEDKPAIIRRMVFRGAMKYAIAKYAEHKAEEEGEKRAEGSGKLWKFGAKVLGQGVAAATEKADTRSWSTLPSEVRGIRLTLPAGDHRVVVSLMDPGGTPRHIDLGVVRVEPGRLAMKSVFTDGRERGSSLRFANASRGVRYRAESDSVTGETRIIPDVP